MKPKDSPRGYLDISEVGPPPLCTPNIPPTFRRSKNKNSALLCPRPLDGTC